MVAAKDTLPSLAVLPTAYEPGRIRRLGLARLWWLPVAVTCAYLILIVVVVAADLSRGDNSLDSLWDIFGVLYGLFVVTLVLPVCFLPGAAAHTWVMHVVETRSMSLLARTTIALALSPLIGAWILVVMLMDSWDSSSVAVSLWLCLGSSALFALVSARYGARRTHRYSEPLPGLVLPGLR